MENVGSVDAGRATSTRCGGAREEKVKATRAQMRRPEALRLRPAHTPQRALRHITIAPIMLYDYNMHKRIYRYTVYETFKIILLNKIFVHCLPK